MPSYASISEEVDVEGQLLPSKEVDAPETRPAMSWKRVALTLGGMACAGLAGYAAQAKFTEWTSPSTTLVAGDSGSVSFEEGITTRKKKDNVENEKAMRQQKAGGKLAKKANHIASPDEATSYKSTYPFFFGSNYKSDGNKKANVKNERAEKQQFSGGEKAKKADHIGDVSFVEQNSKKDNVKNEKATEQQSDGGEKAKKANHIGDDAIKGNFDGDDDTAVSFMKKGDMAKKGKKDNTNGDMAANGETKDESRGEDPAPAGTDGGDYMPDGTPIDGTEMGHDIHDRESDDTGADSSEDSSCGKGCVAD